MYGFLFGAAGTGKSRYLYEYLTKEALLHPEKRYFLFVPEQNTLQAQQAICSASPRHGMLNLDVLSFQLLAYRVMEELGVKKPGILDEMSKSMLLRASIREVAGALKVYGKSIDKPGFIAQIKGAISEFYQYGMTAEKLKQLSVKTEDQHLSAKLSDLWQILSAFQARLNEEKTIPEEIPLLLLKLFGRSELLLGAELYFDGYTGFTPVQLELIARMMTQAQKLQFAVTIPKEAEPYRRARRKEEAADLFWLSRETVAKLSELGEKNGQQRLPELFFETEYNEPELFVSAAQDPREEVRLLLDRIRTLRASRGGFQKASAAEQTDRFRYRQMAVTVSDLSAYQELLREAFTRAGVPFFLDERADGRLSAAARLLRSALSVLTENYSYESVLRYLRNPLVQTDRELTDRIDNYVRALGLRGRRAFSEVWDRTARTMEDMNLAELCAYRDKALSPVLLLQEEMGSGDKTVASRIQALLRFLERSSAAARTEAFCSRLSSAGFFREAEENRRFYDAVLFLFDSMKAVLSKERMPLKDFAAVLEAGFSELRAGMLPEVLDRVVIGDMKRSRFDGISVLFLLGANDGLLPSVVSGGGVFTDREREEILAEGTAELAPSDRIDSSIQRFYLYLAMKKPSSLLYLSYSKSDMQGKRLKPSVVLLDLLAEQAEKGKPVAVSEEKAEDIFTEEEALFHLAEALSAGKPEEKRARALCQYLRRKTALNGAAERLLKAAFIPDPDRSLSPETARMLYGDVLYGSVTRIEQYVKCPYAHFLRYGLRLLERQQYDIAALDIGNLYHSALELGFRELGEDGRSLSELTDGELSALSKRAVEAVSAEYNNQIMQSSARNRYLRERVGRITGRTFWALREQLRKGDFSLYGCELPFQLREGELSLHGRIDRMDVCEDRSKVYVKVIDYKSGRAKFDLSMVWQGLELQLVTYMNVALQRAAGTYGPLGKEAVPAGLFYYHIDDPVLSYEAGAAETGTERAERMLRELRLNGLVSGEEEALSHLDRELLQEGSGDSAVIPVKLKEGKIQERGSRTADEETLRNLSRFGTDKMKELSQEILSGDIGVRPYRQGQQKGCDYCPYHSVCGFDRRLPGFSYHNIQSIPKEEVLRRLSERYGGSRRNMADTGAGPAGSAQTAQGTG